MARWGAAWPAVGAARARIPPGLPAGPPRDRRATRPAKFVFFFGPGGLLGCGATALVDLEPIGQQIEAAAIIGCSTQGPEHRRRIERQRLLDLIDQLERVATLAVELVDEGDDGHIAQPADFEELQ